MGASGDHSFQFIDDQHQSRLLSNLGTLRKGGQFCDVQLQVGHHTVRAHRAVLASASPYLHDLFLDEQRNFPFFYKLRDLDFSSFEVLVNYAYTSKLEICSEKVRDVFKTAIRLKMVGAAQACSRYMAEQMTVPNCLGVWQFAHECGEENLMSAASSFICREAAGVVDSQEAHLLPLVAVDILGLEEGELKAGGELPMCKLVVDWAQNSISKGTTLRQLTDSVRVLYLNCDNTLHDCEDIDERSPLNSEFIADYKLERKRMSIGSKLKINTAKSPGIKVNGEKVMNGHSGVVNGHTPDETGFVIAANMVSDKACVCIAVLDNTMVKLSLNVRQVARTPPSNGGSPISPPSPSSSPHTTQQLEKQMSLTPLALMSQARCGAGCEEYEGKLVVIGGYDRGECLNSVELYDMESNSWTALPKLNTPRGRFDVAKMDGVLYACGGCSGQTELKTMEYYNAEKKKWSPLPSMSRCRSSAGFSSLNGQLYVVGGWHGMESCERYDPKEHKWHNIVPMKTKRAQAGVCALEGSLVAVGGCDSWNSFNTVEVYDPEEDTWGFLPPMSTARRGAGVCVFNGKLYVVGGSDGTSVLNTSEIYDPETKSWAAGPTLNTPRANVSVVKVGSILYAVGGFSGKAFLNTVEYLPQNASEWRTFLPLDFSNK